MDNKEQIVVLVKKFIMIANELVEKGEIDTHTYEEITSKKISFLKEVAKDSL
jgi:hypothetical protein